MYILIFIDNSFEEILFIDIFFEGILFIDIIFEGIFTDIFTKTINSVKIHEYKNIKKYI